MAVKDNKNMVNSKICTTLYSENVNYMHCTLFYACSICNKFSELHNLIYSESYDIICICESWLNVNITNGIIGTNNRFSIIRHDRNSV